jgi:cell wall-associated NlpC family hydrolase
VSWRQAAENLARHRVAAEALLWKGTPFFPHMARRGVGADCVHFVLAVYKEAGVAPLETVLPKYTLDGGLHLARSLVLDWLATCPFVERETVPREGSVITFQFGRVPHHVGVVVDRGRFLHSVRGRGVVEGDLQDSTFRDKLTSSWKPKPKI